MPLPKFGDGSLLSRERRRKIREANKLQYLNGFDMEPRIKLAPEARRGKIDWKLWTNEIEREVSGDWAF